MPWLTLISRCSIRQCGSRVDQKGLLWPPEYLIFSMRHDSKRSTIASDLSHLPGCRSSAQQATGLPAPAPSLDFHINQGIMSESIQPSVLQFRPNARLAASWRIIGELFRRHHDRCDLRVLELHPGGGTYDCLSLFARRNDDPFGVTLLHLNAPAQHIHFFDTLHQQRSHPLRLESGVDYVQALFCQADPKEIIDAVEARAGLPKCPAVLPASSCPVLAIRTLAGLLERTVLDRRTMDVHCAWYDSAASGASIAEWARAIPALRAALALSDWREQMRKASRFWRISETNSGPPLLLDFGTATVHVGEFHNGERMESLHDLYLKQGCRIEPVVERLWSLLT